MKASPHNLALYGGTFDPVHLGHLAVARAAVERFALERVYFVPTYVQPLKAKQKVSDFYHRYAMLALALAGEARMSASLLEAPEILHAAGKPASYTVETVARFRARLGKQTRLFFLIGMDAFANVSQWRGAEQLLRSVEFIVAHRPGWPLETVTQALPATMQPNAAETQQALASGTLTTHGAHIHLLPEVSVQVSATAIRKAARQECGLEQLVPATVADYIRKLHLYEQTEDPGTPPMPRI